MYSLHALNHVLTYIPTQVVDHFILIKTQDLRPSSKEQCPPSKCYGKANRAQRSTLHKVQNLFHTTKTKGFRGSNKCTSRHTTPRVTSSSSLEYLTHCQLFYENQKRFQDTYYTSPDAEQISPNKPEDFCALFDGNNNDLFKLGLNPLGKLSSTLVNSTTRI